MVKHENGKVDRRYSIRLEFCGESKPRHVVRFCGDWVGKADTRTEALELARQHRVKLFGV